MRTIFNNYILYAPEYIILLVLLWIFAVFKRKSLIYISIVLTFCLLWFFQGASVPTEIKPRILYCPCDGVVSNIIEHTEYVQICIFLNVHNTHVQYSPFDCTIKQIEHKEGTFHPAYLLEKSQYNERTEYILNNEYFGDVLLVQIAGQIARSIVTFVEESRVLAMQPIGLIKLGSRCDVYVKKGNQILVRKGDRVKIGSYLVSK